MKDFYTSRKYVIQAIFLVTALLFLGRLFWLQIIDDRYKLLADDNVKKEITAYPTRGLIYDRTDKLIVYNEPIYDLMVIPREVKELDTSKFCALLEINHELFEERLKKCRKYSQRQPSVFLKQIPLKSFMKFQEFLHGFPGFFGQVRTIRHYPHGAAAHILGDVGEVDSSHINASDYYKSGDYVGKSGIEMYYEKVLRGEKGIKTVLVDVYGRIQGKAGEGKNDILPISGNDIRTTLDIDLQLYGEKLMRNKTGSIVAIEPSSGEILAMVSSPGFDPNLLCGRERGDNFKRLNRDTLSPLFNRPIMAQYPPGSTFKALNALIALDDGAITENFSYRCNRLYYIPGYVLHCSHHHASAFNIVDGIKHSCNPYFWQTFRNTLDNSKYPGIHESYGAWFKKVASFGLGATLGIDLSGEKPGNVPSVEYYNQLYGERGWRSATVISLGIGQGELLLTPLQLANLFATISNKGFYLTPHIVREFATQEEMPAVKISKHETKIQQSIFEPVIEGLAKVVESGTARRSKMKNIEMCGKTGTAQNPHGEDHSLFAAFAPKENTKIAVAVVVENAGGGSRYAAPIASLMIENYLTDSIATSRKWLEKSILETLYIGFIINIVYVIWHRTPDGQDGQTDKGGCQT